LIYEIGNKRPPRWLKVSQTPYYRVERLFASPGRLMAVGIMHRLAVKFCAMFRRLLAARRHGTVITLAIVETMIDVSVEMVRTVEPRSRTDEYATAEPFRTVITIGSAVVRRSLVIAVRARRRFSDIDRHLRGCVMAGSDEKPGGYTQNT
jgi:hypothetical protein